MLCEVGPRRLHSALNPFMGLAQKSKFRLTMEQSLCGVAILLAGGLFKWTQMAGVLIAGGCLIYLQRVNRELKTRREQLTTQQKRIVFGLLATALGVIVVVIFAAAILRDSAALWIAFALASFYTGAALFFAHSDIFKDEGRV